MAFSGYAQLNSSDQDVGTQEENGRCPSTAGQSLEFSKGTRAQDSYRVPRDSTNTRTAPSVSDEELARRRG